MRYTARMANPLDLINDAQLRMPSPRGPKIAALVVAGLVVALGLTWLLSPKDLVTDDCGPLAELGQDGDEDAPELAEGLVCQGQVEVVGEGIVAVGVEDEAAQDPAKRFAKVRFFARAKGGRVVVALSGSERAVADWVTRHRHLAGFQTTMRGRFYDPEKAPGTRPLSAAVRSGLDLGGDPYFIFDPVL
jgi:hypothetical protein